MDKIADYLLLRSSYMQELGLFHGKMGVVVALYLYADAYGDEVMREYAWELFQQVYDGVHTDMPVGLERGLAGIGYGTTLLCKRGLVECSLNDILEDIDRKIMERDPRRLTDMSVRTGVGGLMLYLDLRQSVEAVATFDSRYMMELQDTVARNNLPCRALDVMDVLNEPTFPEAEYIERPLGIDRGMCLLYIKIHTGMMHIFIFNNASRAANYGIGTYVRLLSDGLLGRSGVKVSFVDLFSDVKEYSIADDERGCRHYQVPALFSGMENEPYCRNVFYFLARHIKAEDDERLVFHFNYFQHKPLASLLKGQYFDCRIVFTVHYLGWCF